MLLLLLQFVLGAELCRNSKKVSGVACFGHLAIDKAHIASLLGRTRYPLVVAWRNSLSIWNEVV